MTLLNRQWLLARRPGGHIVPEDFEYREQAMAMPELKPGELLVKSLLFRCTPAMRTWMKETSQIAPPMAIGKPVTGSSAAQVIASANRDYPVGTVVSASTGWQDYAVIRPPAKADPLFKKPDGISVVDFQGVYGVNSITAYFGLLKVGEPKAGETLVVSGAAGSTGAVAAQIGKIAGCRVIGIAGGAKKCQWLLDDCKLDGVIDYKVESIEDRLKALCPEGVNVFFDNVGGETLDAVIENMARFGRIALCGQISSYDEGNALAPGPRNMMRVIYWRLKLQGFLAFDYPDQLNKAMADLRQWRERGLWVTRDDIHHGFALLPRTFMRLFDGSNFGTLLVRNDDAEVS